MDEGEAIFDSVPGLESRPHTAEAQYPPADKGPDNLRLAYAKPARG